MGTLYRIPIVAVQPLSKLRRRLRFLWPTSPPYHPSLRRIRLSESASVSRWLRGGFANGSIRRGVAELRTFKLLAYSVCLNGSALAPSLSLGPRLMFPLMAKTAATPGKPSATNPACAGLLLGLFVRRLWQLPARPVCDGGVRGVSVPRCICCIS